MLYYYLPIDADYLRFNSGHGLSSLRGKVTKALSGVEVQLHSFLTSALDEV